MLRNAVTNRRNLTPQPPAGTPAGAVADGQHAMRRGGARREVSTRVFLRDAEGKVAHEGWALNVSRGGVRAILEDRVEPGAEFEVEIGTDDGPPRRGRIVWVQEEPDGVIVGVEFTGLSGMHKSAPPPAMEPGEAGEVGEVDDQAVTTVPPKVEPKVET